MAGAQAPDDPLADLCGDEWLAIGIGYAVLAAGILSILGVMALAWGRCTGTL
jgi:hypothetical protein